MSNLHSPEGSLAEDTILLLTRRCDALAVALAKIEAERDRLRQQQIGARATVDEVRIARRHYGMEGEVEIDDNALISRGGDGSAWITAWVWLRPGCTSPKQPYFSELFVDQASLTGS